MTDFNLSDELSARSPGAEKTVKRAVSRLRQFAHGLDFGSENSIPTVELWHREGTTFTIELALQVGRALCAVFNGPVHFFELRGTSVTFFVFDESLRWPDDGPFSARQIEEYGVPFDHWASTVAAELEPANKPRKVLKGSVHLTLSDLDDSRDWYVGHLRVDFADLTQDACLPPKHLRKFLGMVKAAIPELSTDESSVGWFDVGYFAFEFSDADGNKLYTDRYAFTNYRPKDAPAAPVEPLVLENGQSVYWIDRTYAKSTLSLDLSQ